MVWNHWAKTGTIYIDVLPFRRLNEKIQEIESLGCLDMPQPEFFELECANGTAERPAYQMAPNVPLAPRTSPPNSSTYPTLRNCVTSLQHDIEYLSIIASRFTMVSSNSFCVRFDM
jgi:hypothetical protein